MTQALYAHMNNLKKENMVFIQNGILFSHKEE
jgi:hypothetical protein